MSTPDSRFIQIVSGADDGLGASLARAGLLAMSCGYRFAIGVRNRGYDNRGPAGWASVPVISVGNITTGGTGKTPFVAMLYDLLTQRGHKPAILTRGYKAADGDAGDEAKELSDLIGADHIVQNPDRIAGAAIAAEKLGADVLLLDDGFQHRRLARNLDIVLIDATNPFGYGHLLPRGLLREPLGNLARADLIVLTRCDQVAADRLDAIMVRLAEAAPDVPVIRSTHKPQCLVRPDGSAHEFSEALPQRAICFAAIGNPQAFAATVAGLGVEVAATRWWPDHHLYGKSDLDELAELSVEKEVTAFLTTCKDLVKVRALATGTMDIAAVRIGIELNDQAVTILDYLLAEALAWSPDE